MANEKKQFEEYLEQSHNQLVLLAESTKRILSITEASAEEFKNFKENAFFPSVQQMSRINERLIDVESKSKNVDFRETIEYTILKWCTIINSIILFLFFILLMTV